MTFTEVLIQKALPFALINEANFVKCYKASMTSREMNMQFLGCVLMGRENMSMKQKGEDVRFQLQDACEERTKCSNLT